MRKLIESSFLSLDGFVSVERLASLWTPENRAYAKAELEQCDTFLFGRKTYELFAPRWSKVTGDPYMDMINAMPKVVASTTLEDSDMSWNASLLRAPVPEAISRLKSLPGKNIIKYGDHRSRPHAGGARARRRIQVLDLSRGPGPGQACLRRLRPHGRVAHAPREPDVREWHRAREVRREVWRVRLKRRPSTSLANEKASRRCSPRGLLVDARRQMPVGPYGQVEVSASYATTVPLSGRDEFVWTVGRTNWSHGWAGPMANRWLGVE